MEFLIYIGIVLVIAGMVGLVYAMVLAFRIKREGATGAEFTARMQKLGALNMGALGVSALGLMMVVIGILL